MPFVATTTSHVCWYTVSGTSSTTATVWADSRTDTGTTSASVWTYWVAVSNTYTTQEDARAIEQYNREESARMQAAQAAREAAELKAERLLIECLSLRQRLQYEKHKAFIVHGRRARYRIRPGRTANVDVIGANGNIKHRLCAHPNVNVPYADVMLAQKLWLEDAEDVFLRVANEHPGSAGPPLADILALTG